MPFILKEVSMVGQRMEEGNFPPCYKLKSITEHIFIVEDKSQL